MNDAIHSPHPCDPSNIAGVRARNGGVLLRNGKTSRRRGAFTLIELLVVVSIIALLIAMLLPSLSKAKDQARSIKCLVNLRNIGIAVLVYAQDNNNYLPRASMTASMKPYSRASSAVNQRSRSESASMRSTLWPVWKAMRSASIDFM